MINYKNVIIDDLREFEYTPKCMFKGGITRYLRNEKQISLKLIEETEPIYIENLWLDFDLGGDCETPMKFIHYMIDLAHYNENDVVIDNVFVVTANSVGRRVLHNESLKFAKKLVQIVNPVDYGLTNRMDW